MKEKIIITAPEGAVYVKDVLTAFPNGILNKGDVGCGATTYAIENGEPTIICCPSKHLIKNKQSQYPRSRILGVMEGVYDEDIRNYLSSCLLSQQPPKIMVTYDSFYKVKAALEAELPSYRIIVDEYQELLKSALYRNKAILRLLDDVKGHEKITYVSATPIPDEYTPEELKDHNVYEIDWGRRISYKPIRKRTNSPYSLAVKFINEHKAGNGFCNPEGIKADEYYFFINSVRGIQSIIEKAGLSNDEVKVVCADTLDNRRTLGDISISNISDDNKPYTFCTSTVFYGADFYSTSGLIIIVSDGKNRNTRLDIATDILQIAGRIRNKENPFKNIMLHIYNTGLSTSKEKFEEYLNERIRFAEITRDAFKELNENRRIAITARIRMQDDDELALYDEKTETLSINELKVKYLKYRFETIDEVYRNGVTFRETYAKAGCDMSEKLDWEYIAEDYMNSVAATPKFKIYYEDYLAAENKSSIEMNIIRRDIKRTYPEMHDIVSYITPEEIASRAYNISRIKELLYSRLPATEELIKEELGKKIIIGMKYTRKYLKGLFTKIYDKYLIKITPKASTIDRYYTIKDTQVLENGRRAHAYEITGKIFLAFGVHINMQHKLQTCYLGRNFLF